MKRISATLLILVIALMLPYSFASGQEKKSEKKVKVIVSDGNGEKILLDTAFLGTDLRDTILMKNGKVVIIGEEATAVPGEKGKIYVYASAGEGGGMGHSESGNFSWVAAEDDGQVKKIIIRGDETISAGPDGNKTVFIRHASKADDSEKASYVITRDGFRISVEGNDYEKVKQLVNEIEAKIDAISGTVPADKGTGSRKTK